MANTIKIKRSAVQGKVPTVEDLLLGELALNTYDGKLYTLKNDGTDSVIEIGGTSFSTDISLQDQSSTRYYEDSANGTNYIAIRAPSSLSADVVLTLPTTDGDADQVLGTDGNGNLSWVSRVSGSGTSGDFLSTSTASEQSGYFGNIYLKDDSNTSHYLEITNSDDLTELRTLSIDVNDANRSVILSGDLNLANNFTTSGNFALTLTTTASTSITLPTSGTLATLSGVEEFSNKSFSDNVAFATGTQNAPSITFTGDTNTGIYSPDADQLALSTNGAERLRIISTGAIGLSGANYGNAGQVLTSNGSGSAPTWQDGGGGGGGVDVLEVMLFG